MARAFDIPGWLDGVKIRRKNWMEEMFMFFHPINGWRHDKAVPVDTSVCGSAGSMWVHDDWEPFTEPKKKRKVKLYRDICRSHGDYIFLGSSWRSFKGPNEYPNANVIGHEEREIEIEE